MREERILYARSGELELRLESLPPQSTSVGDTPSVDHGEDERRSLETLLHSAGVDPAPFAEALKRMRHA